MGRSSKSITLALIGSALLLSGCAREEEEPEWGAEQEWGQEQEPAPNQVAGGAGVGGHGVFIAPRIGGGGFRGGAASPGASARGGFGATGSRGAGA